MEFRQLISPKLQTGTVKGVECFIPLSTNYSKKPFINYSKPMNTQLMAIPSYVQGAPSKCFSLSDIPTPPSSPLPQKQLIFLSMILLNILKLMKNQFCGFQFYRYNYSKFFESSEKKMSKKSKILIFFFVIFSLRYLQLILYSASEVGSAPSLQIVLDQVPQP